MMKSSMRGGPFISNHPVYLDLFTRYLPCKKIEISQCATLCNKKILHLCLARLEYSNFMVSCCGAQWGQVPTQTLRLWPSWWNCLTYGLCMEMVSRTMKVQSIKTIAVELNRFFFFDLFLRKSGTQLLSNFQSGHASTFSCQIPYVAVKFFFVEICKRFLFTRPNCVLCQSLLIDSS